MIRLTDGSQAELTPVSRAMVRQNVDSTRQAIVLERGSGRFQVEKGDGAFRVETPVGTVTALGTEFTVEVRPAESPARRGAVGPAELIAAMPPQLLVAVLAGEVAVDFGNETYALGLGDDRIYSKTLEMPDTQPHAAGKVVAVAQDDQGATSITLEARKSASSKGGTQTIQLTDATRFDWVNVPVDRQTPSLGYNATVWRDLKKKDTAAAVRFEVAKDAGPPPQLTGRVTKVSPDGRTIALELPHFVKNEPRQSRTVILDASTVETYFFVPLKSERPTVGYQATVWLVEGSNERAREIHFSGDKRGPYHPDLTGRVTAVSKDGKVLEVTTKEKFGSKKGDGVKTQRSIRIESNTKLIYQGVADRQKPVGLDATIWLREGSSDTASGIRFSVPAQ